MTLTVHQPHERRFCKGLFHAPPGHGKTHLLGTAQEDERTSPMAFIDFDSGYESLAGLDIDVFPIRTWQDANEVYEALANKDEKKIDGQWFDFAEYKSVGIDSISEWHRWALHELLRKAKAQRKYPDLIEQVDYNQASTQMRRVLREFRDLPMHVFYAAHSKEGEEPRKGKIIMPDMSGKLAFEVAGLVSVCGYLATYDDEDGEGRMLLLRNWSKYMVKARSRWGESHTIPDEIDDPDITKVLDILGFDKKKTKKGKR